MNPYKPANDGFYKPFIAPVRLYWHRRTTEIINRRYRELITVSLLAAFINCFAVAVNVHCFYI